MFNQFTGPECFIGIPKINWRSIGITQKRFIVQVDKKSDVKSIENTFFSQTRIFVRTPSDGKTISQNSLFQLPNVIRIRNLKLYEN